MDALTLCGKTEIPCLGEGFVRLVDCMPRLVPEGRTLEVAIVRSARVSYGQGVKDKATDDKLIRFLYRNRHTSPFESVEFQFHIRCPMYVRTHFIRHRTANVNEFSQRYREVKDEAYYKPSEHDTGIRGQAKLNKQGSETLQDKSKLQEICKQTEDSVDHTFELYHQLLKEGMSRETARFCLPNSTWTELYYKMDLHNLLHMLKLRMDPHAQAETVTYATAIYELIKPLVPVVMSAFEDYTLNSVTLSKLEVDALRDGKDLPKEAGVAEKEEFEKKKKLFVK